MRTVNGCQPAFSLLSLVLWVDIEVDALLGRRMRQASGEPVADKACLWRRYSLAGCHSEINIRIVELIVLRVFPTTRPCQFDARAVIPLPARSKFPALRQSQLLPPTVLSYRGEQSKVNAGIDLNLTPPDVSL